MIKLSSVFVFLFVLAFSAGAVANSSLPEADVVFDKLKLTKIKPIIDRIMPEGFDSYTRASEVLSHQPFKVQELIQETNLQMGIYLSHSFAEYGITAQVLFAKYRELYKQLFPDHYSEIIKFYLDAFWREHKSDF